MKTILFILSLSLFPFSSIASTVNIPPSIECMDYLNKKSHLTAEQSAKSCAGGVSVDCMNYLFRYSAANKEQVAQLCKGFVSVSCIESVSKKIPGDKMAAAKLCQGS